MTPPLSSKSQCVGVRLLRLQLLYQRWPAKTAKKQSLGYEAWRVCLFLGQSVPRATISLISHAYRAKGHLTFTSFATATRTFDGLSGWVHANTISFPTRAMRGKPLERAMLDSATTNA